MKTRTHITPATSIALAFVLTWFASFRAEAVDAVVTNQSGKTTSVTGLRTLCISTRMGSQVYLGIPTETRIYSDSVFLSIGGDQYRVEIPLEIIKSVAREKAKESQYGAPQFTVVLSDGTSLTGQLAFFRGCYADFTGKTELGDLEMSWNGLAYLAFSSPKIAFQAKANGRRSVTFYTTDDDKRSLSGAAFVIEDRNKNGCFTGFSYQDTIRFATDGEEYQLGWDKIRELRFQNDNTVPKVVKVVSPSGTENAGQIFGALGIEGVSRVGVFDLHLIVPFDSTAKRLTVDEE